MRGVLPDVVSWWTPVCHGSDWQRQTLAISADANVVVVEKSVPVSDVVVVVAVVVVVVVVVVV